MLTVGQVCDLPSLLGQVVDLPYSNIRRFLNSHGRPVRRDEYQDGSPSGFSVLVLCRPVSSWALISVMMLSLMVSLRILTRASSSLASFSFTTLPMMISSCSW